jgi:hypothetical protein
VLHRSVTLDRKQPARSLRNGRLMPISSVAQQTTYTQVSSHKIIHWLCVDGAALHGIVNHFPFFDASAQQPSNKKKTSCLATGVGLRTSPRLSNASPRSTAISAQWLALVCSYVRPPVRHAQSIAFRLVLRCRGRHVVRHVVRGRTPHGLSTRKIQHLVCRENFESCRKLQRLARRGEAEEKPNEGLRETNERLTSRYQLRLRTIEIIKRPTTATTREKIDRWVA